MAVGMILEADKRTLHQLAAAAEVSAYNMGSTAVEFLLGFGLSARAVPLAAIVRFCDVCEGTCL